MAGVDRVTFEIIRHKLVQVVDEAIVALKNVSGSPITNEGHDLMVSLYRAEGSLMVGGVGFLHHLTSAAQAVKHILDQFGNDPGIGEGDAFMLNDPFTAALHPPDIYIISPIHWGDRLAGFVANFVHVTDIGAVDPGGWSPNALDTFQEGFVTQGLKIVEGGRVRRDVVETYLRNVRDPDMVALDLKSQLAANHVAKERMHRLYQEYGYETVEEVATELIEESERLMRKRLQELPDGVWRARQYIDLPDGVHTILLAAIKQADSVTYDFSGTSPQSRYGVNCCTWATWGAMFAPIFPLLGWDIPWNEGITRPFGFVAPEGTLVNAVRPAPVSIATVGVIELVNHLSLEVISKMLAATWRYRERATAVWHGSHAPVTPSGISADGEFFVTTLTDSLAGAGGARAFADGVDLGGTIPNCVSRIANVETEEEHTPILYLFRSAVEDSGGPGKYRGGVNLELAFKPHATSDGITVGMAAKGIAVPMSLGIFGGMPGCTSGQTLYRKAAGDGLPADPGEVAQRAEGSEVNQWGTFHLDQADVQYVRFMGGGGYGDPIERDPEAVLRDLNSGLVSAQVTEACYGVVLTEDRSAVDQEATRLRRGQIRRNRVGQPIPSELWQRRDVPPTGRSFGEYVQQTGSVDDVWAQCKWCGARLQDGSRPWKEGVKVREVAPSTAGRHRECVPGLVLRQFFCPSCATLLDTEVTLSSDPPLHDEVRWQTESPPKVRGEARIDGASASRVEAEGGR